MGNLADGTGWERDPDATIICNLTLTLWDPALVITVLSTVITSVLPLKNTFVKMPLKYDVNSIGNR